MHRNRLEHVKINIHFDQLEAIIESAAASGSASLFEHEAYGFLKALGSETPPKTYLIPAGETPSDVLLMSLSGGKVVLKIVSPTILHKTAVGGGPRGTQRS